jgi:hypothetical protein
MVCACKGFVRLIELANGRDKRLALKWFQHALFGESYAEDICRRLYRCIFLRSDTLTLCQQIRIDLTPPLHALARVPHGRPCVYILSPCPLKCAACEHRSRVKPVCGKAAQATGMRNFAASAQALPLDEVAS